MAASRTGTGPVGGAAASLPVDDEEEGTAEVGLFLLGSPGMKEAVYIGYSSQGHVFVDMRNSTQPRNNSQHQSVFQSSFRTINVAPFPKPASGVLQLHVFFDYTAIEVFASDCTCSPHMMAGGLLGNSLSTCECRNSSSIALAVTGWAFPLHKMMVPIVLLRRGPRSRHPRWHEFTL